MLQEVPNPVLHVRPETLNNLRGILKDSGIGPTRLLIHPFDERTEEVSVRGVLSDPEIQNLQSHKPVVLETDPLSMQLAKKEQIREIDRLCGLL